MPLYTASDKWEYMTTPNQHGKRFGKRFYYNRYGMRCDEIAPNQKHILGLGDSVLFGGAQTDQDSLATTLFTQETGVQMLNISAGSWGPDNCAAYLKEHGLFDAIAVFLLVSSHDAHDNMDFKPVAGKHISYPDKQYFCAIAEVLCRYVWPRIAPKDNLDPDQKVLKDKGIHKSGISFNPGFEQLKEMCDKAHIPLLVCLHAELEELNEGKYNEQGEEIIEWCQANNVKLIRELDYHFTPVDYRDGIHLSECGQRKLADLMKSSLTEYKN